jgi:MFS family permease
VAEPVAEPDTTEPVPADVPVQGPVVRALLRLGEAFTFPGFRNLWTAAFTSAVGTWMQRFAQQWLIYDLTGSAFYLGLDMFVGNVPLLLFTLIGGVTADRYDRRHMLMASQILQMVCALILTALVFTETVRLPYILVLSFTTGLAQAFGGPAFQSLIPALVPRRTLPNAVALNSIQFNLAQSVGPLIGGLVFTTLGLVACFGINSASFLVVIVVLSLLQVSPPNPAQRRPVLEELKGGLTYVGNGGALLALTVLAISTTSLGLPIRAFLPVFAGDPNTLSHMMTSLGTGAVAGALVVAWLGSFERMGLTLLRVLTGFGGLVSAFALLPVSPVSYVLLFLAGGALLIVFSLTASLVQLNVPDELRGRVMSIYLMAFRGGMPLGSLASGYLTTFASTQTIIAANGGLLVLVALYFLARSHGIREL